MLRRILLSASLLLTSSIVPAFAGFGVKESGNLFEVDTDGGLVFTVDKRNGDVTSMLFNGIQAQDQSRRSHIVSGLGTAPCSWTKIGNYIKITCTTSTLTQYYVAQYKNPAIHMATYITAEPSAGELRFIARLNTNAIPNGYAASKVAGSSSTVEGSDIFVVSGQTRSKFYSSRQFIDNQVYGATGPGIGAYMIIPGTGYESASGGPFFRDINNQNGNQQEIYYYMNSGHTQTEAYRMGLHGPYLLQFTTGGVPSADINLAFWDGLGIQGYVPRSGRGFVKGKATGVPSNYTGLVVIGWSNSVAQYWARAEASTGNYYSPAMKPGTYNMTMYKGELAIANSTVTISAGQTGMVNIQSAEANPTVIWQIGDFDGTPRGFLNADMHRWLRTYTIGQQDIGDFPMAIFKAIGPATVQWTLNNTQTGERTLEIGVTLAFAGGRPQVTINDWTGPDPPAPSQPNSRGVTRGTWRGNNTRYTVKIPAGVLRFSKVNVMTINVISGSDGNGYLSPNFVIDAVRLY
ncbi:polysaccharide lyase family 4 protein [Rhizoctonia solani 123E]|uniref:rhamnogalacturonan endolyase n=1 Tax=Rhizoctonia solani 123E TaxID=1423351 RepID=A0A074S2I8_9AGAM|nr:polysaccharide lyase family 4 protein [Rhizoctonia solani 123E]